MASGTVCALVPVEPPSRLAGTRVGSVSLPEYESLRTSQDFRRVLGEGTRKRHGGILVVSAPGQEGSTKVGLVASKSSRSAVTRNRIKRRLRHAVAGLKLQPGTDYVIIASEQVSEVPFTRLVSWLSHALGEPT